LRAVLGSYSIAASAALLLFSCVAAATVRLAANAPGGAPDGSAARVATYVLLLHPYLLGDKLLRNADAEFAALCLAPLALAGVLLADRAPRRALGCVAAGTGLVALTHNLTALVVVVVVAGLALLLHGTAWRRLAPVVGGLALGLGLSAFVWMPALWLGRWVRTEELLAGKFDFHASFPSLAAAFGHREFFGAGWLTPAVLAGCALACASARVRRSHGRLLLSMLAIAAGSLFLQLRASTFLWESLPWLALFQFPWRLMGPVALVTALAASLGFGALTRGWDGRTRRAAEVVVLALCLVDAAPRLGQYEPLAPEESESLADWLRPESIRAGPHRVTVGDEYLPRSADAGAWLATDAAAGPVVATDPRAHVDVLEDRGRFVEVRVAATAETAVRFARWYFPGWSATRDGESVPVGPDEAGRVELRVPAGESVVALRLAAPLARRIGLVVSLASLLVVTLVARARSENDQPAATGRCITGA
jgi:hypothetical protein